NNGSPTAFTVPFLTEVTNYDLLNTVIREKQNWFDKIFAFHPVFKVAGHLSHLLDNSLDKNILLEFGDPIVGTRKFNRYFVLQIQGERKHVKKHVEIRLENCEISELRSHPKQGDIILNMNIADLSEQRHLYVIDRVFTVGRIYIKVVIDNEECDLRLSGRIPIGFMYQKYSLGRQGVLGPREMSSFKHHKNAKWIRKAAFCEWKDSTPGTSDIFK
ncbi:unnamed protein product, partial [Owenia fusiformis]